ncbi:MAG: restriction endonuclease [Candidatus Bathyarchaeota archaeon]|jgi:Holliday junction resolvase-like predicted endonuclease/predicted transcriptional regulator
MTTKTDVIISILKHTTCGPVGEEAVAMDANVPVQVANNVLRKLREIGSIEYENELIELTSNQRVKLAIHAINHGTDIERVCKVLEWKEFENFAAAAFEENNFAVKRRFRFKASGRRWEIDVVAYSEPIIVCVDCKRWRRGWGNSAIKRVTAAQAQRTEALAGNLQSIQREIGLGDWKDATLFPVILSLFPGPVKFYSGVPVVPILQLQNFLDEFQGHINELIHFKSALGLKLSDYVDRCE